MVSFQLGVVHVALSALSLAFWMKIRAYDRKAAAHVIFWLVIGVVFGYLMSVYSDSIWGAMQGMRYIQFPWRFFLILNFALCFLIGALAVVFSGKFLRPLVFAAAILVVAVNIGFCKPDSEMKSFKGVDWKAWLYEQTPRDVMEYLPVWVKKVSVVSPERRVEIVQGQGEVLAKGLSPGPKTEFVVRTVSGALIAYHHFYFPGWSVFIDGKETKINFENDLGIMLFVVPPGEHQVLVRFGHTPVRVIGEIVSVLAWCLLLGSGCFFAIRKIRSIYGL
jgi:hypothetical protein